MVLTAPASVARRREATIGRGLAILLFLSGAADAHSEPHRQRKAAARASFISGSRAYQRGEFELALNHFQQGYALVPQSGFLFDMAQCRRQLGQYRQAFYNYQRYLEEARVSGENAAVVEALIADVKVKQARLHPPGRMVGDNDTVLHLQVGWPGISATLLHGVSPTVDLGAIVTFNYAVEGLLSNPLPGIKLQGRVGKIIWDSGRLNLGVSFSPGALLYFGTGNCPGRLGCDSNLVGLTAPLALAFGMPLSVVTNIHFGLEIPFWVYLNQGRGAEVPLLMGGGIEYYFERDLAITLNLRMGPAISSRGNVDFDLKAVTGLAMKL
jgi:hypothetical protein